MKEFIAKSVKSEEWMWKGKDFNVLLRKHKMESTYDNTWCLYAVIGNGHPLFEKASQNTTDYDLELGDELYGNFHGGCTFYAKQATYVKIGCDYKHIDDCYFWRQDELCPELIADAEDLYKCMEKIADEGVDPEPAPKTRRMTNKVTK